MTTTWRCFIWMFCYCTKCSIYPAVIFADEGYKSGSNTADLPTPLQKCHAYTTFPAWNTHLSISTHYTLLPSYHTETWYTMNPSKTSAPLPFIYFQQFREWPGSRQLTRTLRGRRFPNSTYRWWTLHNRDGTRKNILHTWKWVTQQCMWIPMPLWE